MTSPGNTAHRPADEPYPHPEMLTMPEVAKLLRIPIATLRYWRHLGTGPRSFRMGRSVRYFRTDVYAWLQELSDHSRDD
jgi:predicted DNA-binding transcriptional regulator AlpA